jgi:hypothetical protein
MAQNFLWGPFQMTAGATAGVDYRDNANLSPNHPKADVLLTLGPTLSGGVYLPFAGGEKLTLTAAATYTESLLGVVGNQFGAPLTATLLLPIYVAEWTVSASDTFIYSTDALQSTFAVNTSTLREYSNIANVSATRQFGKFATTFAAQRNDYIYPTVSDLAETDYQFSFSPSFMLAQGYSVFVRGAYGMTYLDLADPLLQDSSGYSIDAGVNGQITPALNGTISVGFSHDRLAANGTNTAHNIDGVDSNVALSYTHPLRPNTTHSIAFFRSPGVTLLLKNSSIVQATGISYTLSHRLNQYLTLSPQVGWSHLVSLYSTGEVADLLQVGISLRRTFTKRLTGSISYLRQIRDSNIPANTYNVDDVTISAYYTF